MENSERKKLYLTVADRISNDIGDGFICGNIAEVHKFDGMTFLYEAGCGQLPEFDLFQPTADNKAEFLGHRITWFDTQDERVNVLLLCAEMCNDKTATV